MNLKDIIELQKTLDIYNEFLHSTTDDTPLYVMQNILHHVHNNCSVLDTKYKGYKFRVKSYHWPPSEDNWTLHDTEFTLVQLKMIYNCGLWTIRFMYENDSAGGYGVQSIAQCYSSIQYCSTEDVK